MGQCERCGAEMELGRDLCTRCASVETTDAPPRGADAPGVEDTALADDRTVVADDPTVVDDSTVAMTPGGSPVDDDRGQVTLRTRLREVTHGEYEILDELGRGGMATVYRAHDLSLDRKVAIKVMAPHLMEGEGMAERFKLEARTAAQLSHPHIIPIYAVKESASILFFVMKYVEGRALDEIIGRTGQLPIAMVKDILIKVGGALGYAHRRGVVHRDVKPGNVMIDEEGTPIVTDFGIAKVAAAMTGLTITGTTMGTPSYMSPEQCEAKEVTGASDQYSLGIVAFHMLTGRLPYEGDSAVTVMYKHCHEDLPPLKDYRPDCPDDLLKTVTRMVAKDPADRWPSLDAAIQKLSLGGSSEAYLDPIRKELVRAAKEGDFERLAELSTGGRALSGVDAGSDGEEGTEPLAAVPTGGRRRMGIVAGIVLLAGALGVAVVQPWAADEAAPVEALAGSGDDGTGQVPVTSGTPTGGTPVEGDESGAGGADGGPEGGQRGGPDGPVDGGGGSVLTEEGDPDGPEGDPAGGGSDPGTTPPARIVVSDIRISGAPNGLTVGETAGLSATALDRSGATIPDDAVERCQTHGWSECGVRWSSDASGVVEVSAAGMITARSAGTARISATIGGETGVVMVTVAEAPVASLTVTPGALHLVVGERGRVEAEAHGPSNEVLRGRPPTWSSADTGVARVNPGGMVEGVGAGRTSVTATVEGARAGLDVVVVENAADAVPRLVEEFGAALAREDLAAAKALFPAMSAESEQRFIDLFEAVEMREVRLDVEAVTSSGESARAVLRGVYVLDDPRAGIQELAIVLDAGFNLTADGVWRITQWDQQAGAPL